MTATAPRRNLVAYILHTFFVQAWARIDARDRGQIRVGNVSARTAAVITAVTASLMLVTLRFVVMDQQVQARLAAATVDAAFALDYGLGVWLTPYAPLLDNLSWVLGCVLCYVIIPAGVVRIVFGLTLSEFYMAPRDYAKHLPIYALLFLPVALSVIGVAQSPEFQMHYPFHTSRVGVGGQLVWELGYGIQFFALEFFFRGFLLRGLAADMGASAILAMSIPYCMIHFGKPLPECLGSILAGTVLGTLAMDTRSIWGGVTIHVAVAWLMDGAALWLKAKGHA
ncbi:MAG: CPBP family intramembrane metalloprotease [Deltaproteobacteria bacterium]|nr:CPBP family intramembrane metalloprotease [Deltaproteobacteria bacterium]